MTPASHRREGPGRRALPPLVLAAAGALLPMLCGCHMYSPEARQVPLRSGTACRQALRAALSASQPPPRAVLFDKEGMRVLAGEAGATHRFRYRDTSDLAVYSNSWGWRRELDFVTLIDGQGQQVRFYWTNPYSGDRPGPQVRSRNPTAEQFVDALQDMKLHAVQGTAAIEDFAEFQKRARAWRALAQKPELPEEAKRCRVLAENAVRSKELDEAVRHYERGLSVAPMWAEGYYNAALLCGEVKNYLDAADYARRYLELCPDAPEAEQLRKRIYVWEEEARKQGWAADGGQPSNP